MQSRVDEYINSQQSWSNELKRLRNIILTTGLNEDFKWRHPCYTLNGKNILLLFEDRDHCGLNFFKGVLLKDHSGLLYKQTENMQTDRQLRFMSSDQIIRMEEIIRSYITEAIKIELEAKTVTMKKTEDYPVPSELQELLDSNSEFRKSFEKLTPGRQRGYLLHFSAPKQSKTRYSRIERSMDRVLMTVYVDFQNVCQTVMDPTNG